MIFTFIKKIILNKFELFFTLLLLISCNKDKGIVECTQLMNNINNEKIFLKCESYGGHYYFAISLKDSSNSIDSINDYFTDYECHFLYYLVNDTLNIYGCDFKKPQTCLFKTKICIHEVDDLRDLYNNKENLNMSFFPKFREYIYLNK